MGVELVVAGIGAAIAAGGAVQSSREAKKQSAIVARTSAETRSASQRAEAARRKQAALEATRARRRTIREALAARGRSISTGVAQGVSLGSSSIQGATAEIAQSEAFELNQINQSEDLGNEIFDDNSDLSDAQTFGNIVLAESQGRQSTARGVQQVGQSLFNKSETIGKISTSLFTSGNA